MDENEKITEAWKEFGWLDDILKDIIYYVILCAVPIGLLLNVTFLYVVVRVPSMRTVVNVYLGNLAVADSIFLMCQFTGNIFFSQSWLAACIVAYISNSSEMASYSIVTALAHERFHAICHPLKHRAESSKAQAAKRLAKIWIIATIIGSARYSTEKWGNDAGLYVAGVTLMLTNTVCLFAVTFLYACVVKKLRQQPQITSTHDGNHRLRQVVLMLIVNTVIFFVLHGTIFAYMTIYLVYCWSNFSVLSKMELLPSMRIASFAVAIFQLLNCSVDPLVYGGINSEYQKAFREAFSHLYPRCCCRCFRRHRDTQKQSQEQMMLQDPQQGRDTMKLSQQQIKVQVIHQDQDVSQETADQEDVHIHRRQNSPHQREEIELQIIHQDGQQVPQQQADQVHVEVEIHHSQGIPHQLDCEQSDLQEIKQSQDIPQQPTDQVKQIEQQKPNHGKTS